METVAGQVGLFSFTLHSANSTLLYSTDLAIFWKGGKDSLVEERKGDGPVNNLLAGITQANT